MNNQSMTVYFISETGPLLTPVPLNWQVGMSDEMDDQAKVIAQAATQVEQKTGECNWETRR
jgi:hypothetical protein